MDEQLLEQNSVCMGPGNYYGCLYISTDGEKFYWSVENYDGHDWCEIPEYLYRSLAQYGEER